jgi:hypothetical protein
VIDRKQLRYAAKSLFKTHDPKGADAQKLMDTTDLQKLAQSPSPAVASAASWLLKPENAEALSLLDTASYDVAAKSSTASDGRFSWADLRNVAEGVARSLPEDRVRTGLLRFWRELDVSGDHSHNPNGVATKQDLIDIVVRNERTATRLQHLGPTEQSSVVSVAKSTLDQDLFEAIADDTGKPDVLERGDLLTT